MSYVQFPNFYGSNATAAQPLSTAKCHPQTKITPDKITEKLLKLFVRYMIPMCTYIDLQAFLLGLFLMWFAVARNEVTWMMRRVLDDLLSYPQPTTRQLKMLLVISLVDPYTGLQKALNLIF